MEATREARRVARAVEAGMAALLADLRRWVAHDTPTEDISALDALARVMAADCARAGLDVDLVPSPVGLNLHAGVDGRGRARVALLGHHDTVFPSGTAGARPLVVEGGRVLGPGVADMKGGLALALHVARHLAAGPRPFRRLELVSVPDEEVRTGPFPTLERLHGFDAVLCLECGRADGSIVSERKGALWVQLVAEGRAAHAGVEPDVGRNAVVALAREALRIQQLHRAREGVTVQVTRFSGGDVVNTVPARAELAVDVRAAHAADLDWALERIRAFQPHDGVRVRLLHARGTPPLERTPAVQVLARTAIALASALGVELAESSTGGVSDACWTAGAGLPSLDGLGPVGGLDHTPEEYVELPSFASRAGTVAGLVAAVDAGVLDGVARLPAA